MGRVHVGSPGPFQFQLPESMPVLNLPLRVYLLKRDSHLALVWCLWFRWWISLCVNVTNPCAAILC